MVRRNSWVSPAVVPFGERKVYNTAIAVDAKRAQHRHHHSENGDRFYILNHSICTFNCSCVVEFLVTNLG